VRHSSDEPAPPPVTAVAETAAYRATDLEFERAATQLRTALLDPRSGVSPETLAAVERNLRVIDGALVEIKAALQKDPGNPALGRLLAATHQKKVDTLRRVLRLSQI
jgi:hypothetical protein